MKTLTLLLLFPFLLMSDAFSYEKLFEPTPVGQIELKSIPAVLVAEAQSDQDYFSGDNRLFRRLFRYIQDNDISMTTPVEAELSPGQMRFFVASSQAEKINRDGQGIQVYERAARQVVSIGLRGSYSENRFEEGLAALQSWLQGQKEWVADGDPVAVYWNGPFTLPMLKKSEVYIPVKKAEPSPIILMVMTSAATMSDGKPTGVWLEEFSVPYQMFIDAGFNVTLSSILGGAIPVDPRSITAKTRPENFESALSLLQDSVPLSEIDAGVFDAVFFPGGHGAMFDLPKSPLVHRLVNAFMEAGKPSAFVCHGPAALVGVVDQLGEPVVKGRRLTGFTDEEEAAVALTEEMPFLLETRLRELGARFEEAPNFQKHVVVDRNLITGQNPASSEATAQALLDPFKHAELLGP